MGVQRVSFQSISCFCTCILFLCLSMGCVNRLSMPKESFLTTEKESLVFGRLDVVSDGQPLVVVGTRLADPKFNVEIHPIFSTNELPYPGDGGGHGFFITRPDGYFAIAIPPGRYVLKLFQYTYKFALACTYIQGGQGGWIPVRQPVIVTFEVPQAKSVYIGTIKVDMSTNFSVMTEAGRVRTGYDRVEIRYAPVRSIGIEQVGVENEIGKAREVFSSMYPTQQFPLDLLAQVTPYTPRK